MGQCPARQSPDNSYLAWELGCNGNQYWDTHLRWCEKTFRMYWRRLTHLPCVEAEKGEAPWTQLWILYHVFMHTMQMRVSPLQSCSRYCWSSYKMSVATKIGSLNEFYIAEEIHDRKFWWVIMNTSNLEHLVTRHSYIAIIPSTD